MKEIILVMTSMSTGGIATSIVNLLNNVDLKKNKYTLALFNNDFSIDIPKEIEVVDLGYPLRLLSISQKETFNENFILGLYRLFLGLIVKLFGHHFAYKILFKKVKPISKKYDVAISCSQSAPLHNFYGGCNEFVLDKINATQKISFIHCDYISYNIDNKINHDIYSKFDKIACVSESVKNQFLKCEPDLEKRVFVVKNTFNISKIKKMSEIETYNHDSSITNMVTVARLGREKGHSRMLPIIKNLKDKKLVFKWHVVGGNLNDLPKKDVRYIRNNNLENFIVFHGKTNNPYRILKKSDFLLVPSLHEAAPMVFDEAAILGVPVVSTETLSADEMVSKRNIGIVCGNNDFDLENVLEMIISGKKQIPNFKPVTKDINNDAIKQFNDLINFWENAK